MVSRIIHGLLVELKANADTVGCATPVELNNKTLVDLKCLDVGLWRRGSLFHGWCAAKNVKP